MSTAGPPRVLVIDDDQAIRSDFRKILCPPAGPSDLAAAEAALFGEGGETVVPETSFDVDLAAQGAQGHEMLCAALQLGRPYCVAIVDMRMPPGWDGLETIEKLWKADSRLQVVICTAYSDYSWNDVAVRLGRTDNLLILKKPVDPVEVWQMTLSLAEKWNLREAGLEKLRQAEELARELRQSNLRLQREISDRRLAQEQSTHDELTGLANRRNLLGTITGCLERQRRDPTHRYGVLFLDVDNFKLVNDVFGHPLGDELLINVAQRLRGCLADLGIKTSDDVQPIARIGGDEFVIVLDGLRKEIDCAQVAQAVLRRLSGVFDLGPAHTRVNIGASIGIAVGGPAYHDAEDLLRDADTAMYRAKTGGKARFAVFDPEMHRTTKLRLQIENGLREAIPKNEFRVAYQPIVKLPNRELMGFEALLRWDGGPEGGSSPEAFIPVAEESGLIVPIGRWVLDAAAMQMARWRDLLSKGAGAFVSVNVSRREIIDPGFVDGVRDALSRHGLPGSWLKLEVTESGVIDEVELASHRLNELKKLGVGLYMDDFGTGYSSLSCLNRLPFDLVKVDRSFTADMIRNGKFSAVIRAVVAMARSLELEVLVEGVETEEQQELVTQLGCDYAQGFAFSRPVDSDQATMMLRAGTILPARSIPAPVRSGT